MSVSDETIISEELACRGVHWSKRHTWSGNFWIRKFNWPLPPVTIRQYSGSRDEYAPTGRAITVSLPRYWRLLWQLRRERGADSLMPAAKVVRR